MAINDTLNVLPQIFMDTINQSRFQILKSSQHLSYYIVLSSFILYRFRSSLKIPDSIFSASIATDVFAGMPLQTLNKNKPSVPYYILHLSHGALLKKNKSYKKALFELLMTDVSVHFQRNEICPSLTVITVVLHRSHRMAILSVIRMKYKWNVFLRLSYLVTDFSIAMGPAQCGTNIFSSPLN